MHALSVEQLTKTYANGTAALKGIDLEVAEGDFFALLGQNGAGKSTSIGIISSLINKSAGHITIFGHDLDQDPVKAKSLLGVMPQEINFTLFEKVIDILIYQAGYYGIPRKLAMERAEHNLSELGLYEMRNLAAIQLSGGMKRRLMIARALMNHPKLLILDEPTAGVDIELRHLLWRFLTKLNRDGTTIILTTHYLEEAEHLCKHVAIIDHGEIIEQGRMKTLINRINAQTLIIDAETPLPSTLAINGYTLQPLDDFSFEVKIEGTQSINELFALLNQNKIDVKSLRNKTNRLEELYLRLVSKNKKK